MKDIRGPYMSQELDTVITEAIFQLLFTKSTEEDHEIVKLLETLGFKIGMKMYWRERERQIIN